MPVVFLDIVENETIFIAPWGMNEEEATSACASSDGLVEIGARRALGRVGLRRSLCV
jgi:hypothetical protein